MACRGALLGRASGPGGPTSHSSSRADFSVLEQEFTLHRAPRGWLAVSPGLPPSWACDFLLCRGSQQGQPSCRVWAGQ